METEKNKAMKKEENMSKSEKFAVIKICAEIGRACAEIGRASCRERV